MAEKTGKRDLDKDEDENTPTKRVKSEGRFDYLAPLLEKDAEGIYYVMHHRLPNKYCT